MCVFLSLFYSSKRIWKDMLALQASPTKCTGSLSRGALSSPWWLLVRTHAAVFALVFYESRHCIYYGWHLEALRCVCVCEYVQPYLYSRGMFPSFVVLIGESERRGTCCWYVNESWWKRKEAFGMCLSGAALSESKSRQSLKMLGCGGWQQANILLGWSVPIWRENVSLGQDHFLWWDQQNLYPACLWE